MPIRSVGVQGDGRTYLSVLALSGPLDYRILKKVSTDLCNSATVDNRAVVLVAPKNISLESGTLVKQTINSKRIRVLQEADFIARRTMEQAGQLDAVWQFPVILIPISFSGGESIVLRPVNSVDGMTASFSELDEDLVVEIAGQIANLDGVDAVFLDVSNKPPATIEWE